MSVPDEEPKRAPRTFYALSTPETFLHSSKGGGKGVANARNAIGELAAAAGDGDANAADALVAIAADASLAVEKLYEDRPDLVKEIASRREHFPVLYSRRTKEQKQRDLMMLALPLGGALPLLPGKVDADLREVVRHTVSRIYFMRDHPRRRNELERRSESLPPLVRASVGAWASVLRDWILPQMNETRAWFERGNLPVPDLFTGRLILQRAKSRNEKKAYRRALKMHGLAKGAEVSEVDAAKLAGKGFKVSRVKGGRPKISGFTPKARASQKSALAGGLLDEIKDILKGIAPPG